MRREGSRDAINACKGKDVFNNREACSSVVKPATSRTPATFLMPVTTGQPATAIMLETVWTPATERMRATVEILIYSRYARKKQ
jgi:hypothetical protein